ncbi:hypothetical protein HGRIS_001735 [Hohenbuehelia grisea]|uniref:Ketoreductase (KR) domain-containing protein n=1 Tax=Hohenbuehelia grisea TaxID=104357 RepID=A0ABR3JK25_9AGAR
MVLGILQAAATKYFPTQYWTHILIGFITIAVVHAFSQGRKTNRERALHARTILVTGGFTPTGLTLLQELARRGAHIIALTPHPIESPNVSLLIDLLRSTTSNEQIYAEQCDLASPSSIRSFCTKFLTGKETRLDAIIYAHEYQHIGSTSFVTSLRERTSAAKREAASLSTFLMTTLLLPCLLVAPVERDIRIIHVVNPFYAAGAGLPSISPSPAEDALSGKQARSAILEEGLRSLRTSVLARHLQRVLDALPAAQVPKTDDNSSTVPVVSAKSQKSNIVAISVSPGISRSDTVAQILNADWNQPFFSRLGVFMCAPQYYHLMLFPLTSLQILGFVPDSTHHNQVANIGNPICPPCTLPANAIQDLQRRCTPSICSGF